MKMEPNNTIHFKPVKNDKGEWVSVPLSEEEVVAEEKRKQDLREEFRGASQPIVDDLTRAGIIVASLQELAHKRIPAQAVPILLKWLPKLDNLRVKEVIVRSLTDPAAKPTAAIPLIKEFHSAPGFDTSYK